MIVIKDRAHMSIGRSFSIKRLVNASFATDKGPVKGKAWLSGNEYNYGMLPPRYPVPMHRTVVEICPTVVCCMVERGDDIECSFYPQG